MKYYKSSLLVFAFALTYLNVASQNALINVLTRNSGMVRKGETVFLEVTINNTDPASSIVPYKIKAQISVPSSIASVPATGHVLPTGWVITSNTGSTIFVSNGTDTIAPNSARTILIAIQGNKPGGPSTIVGQLTFSNGNPPGTAPGALPGDNPADNSSTSTCKVIK